MMIGSAAPKLAPGVLGAVAWLMGREGEGEANLLLRASVIGLLRRGGAVGSWKCDGSLLTRLVRHRVRSGKLPKHGSVLIGIGEMTARSHADEDEIQSILCRLLRRAYPETSRLHLLQQALDVVRLEETVLRSSSSSMSYDKDELSIMDWKQITFAGRWMRHPEPLGSVFGYGLRLIVRVLLRNDPARLRWFASEAGKRGLLSATTIVVGEACYWNERTAKQALKSGVPLFVSFGVAKICDGGKDGDGSLASTVNAMLIDHKVAHEGRLYVSAFMLKQAVHAWYRQKDRLFENKRTRAILEIDPHQAIGGEREAVRQIERLREEAPELEMRRAAVMLELEDALRTAAQQNIDPHKLWSVFEPSLVDTPEIRHRFAMAHTDAALRRAALEEALATFDELVGVRHLETSCDENFDPIRSRREFAFWAANSQVELSKIKRCDAGHDAARRIASVEPVLRNFVLQPFAATRFHQRFQNNVGRWSVMLQFAFLVALSDQKTPLVRLREDALKSASGFLPIAERFADDPQWMEAVAGLVADAVSAMQLTDVREWIDDERQPPLLRAQLIWACPAILSNSLHLAMSLVDKVVAPQATRAAANRNASYLFNILDRAAVSMLYKNRSDLYPYLAKLIDTAAAQAEAPLARSLSMQTLLAALNGDPGARIVLLESPIWGRSRLGEAIRYERQLSR